MEKYLYTYFPKIWKVAKIIPLPKPGEDQLFPQNYRSISLLNELVKILEKSILRKLCSHLAKDEIINNAQYGFRPGYCTTRQLARVVYTITSNLNKNKNSCAVLLDIKKAFDTVCHKSLICKLKDMNVPIDLIQLINSYITKRSFVVEKDGLASDSRDIVAGVPQGSVLGPTLFSIYI